MGHHAHARSRGARAAALPLALKKEKPGHRSTNMGSSGVLEPSEETETEAPAARAPRPAALASRRAACGRLPATGS